MVHLIHVYRIIEKTTSGKILNKNKKEYKSDTWGSPVLSKERWKQWADNHGIKIKFHESPRKVIFVAS